MGMKGYLYRKVTGNLTPREKAKKAEKYWSGEEKKAYQKEIAEERRKAYWGARKESEVARARARGASYKPIGASVSGGLQSIGKGLGTMGKGMTAKGGFLDFSGTKKGGSLLGIEPSSEFGNWIGGSSRHRRTRRRTRRIVKHHRPHHRTYRHKRVIEYY